MNVISTTDKIRIGISKIEGPGKAEGVAEVVRGAVKVFNIVPGKIEAGFKATAANRENSPVIKSIIDMLSRNFAGKSYTEDELRMKWMAISQKASDGDHDALVASKLALEFLVDKGKTGTKSVRDALR
jgi:hypothetical protein